jgi:sugar phosphate isomerase/epimerase
VTAIWKRNRRARLPPIVGRPAVRFNFISVGYRDVPWRPTLRMLPAIGYNGPISIEWEDSGMSRDTRAAESPRLLRSLDFEPSSSRFDEDFNTNAHST